MVLNPSAVITPLKLIKLMGLLKVNPLESKALTVRKEQDLAAASENFTAAAIRSLATKESPSRVIPFGTIRH